MSPYAVIGVVTADFKQPFDPDVEAWMPVALLPWGEQQSTRCALPRVQWRI
jgi:hypothetical protein